MIIQSRFLLLSLVFLAFLTGCDVVEGSGRVTKEERGIGNFSGVDVQGSMDVIVTKGSTTSATIEAEDNLIQFIELDNRGDELKVKFRNNTNIRSRKRIKIYLTTPQLDKAEMSGSGNLSLEGIFTAENKIKLGVSGSGNIKGHVDAPEVEVDLSGSGNITLKGETREVDIDIAGSGNCRVEELLAETAKVNIAGSGGVRLFASRQLKANILGSGSIKYKGDPSIEMSKMGSGSVSKL